MDENIVMKLSGVLNALNSIDVRGRSNMQNVLGCIGIIEGIINDMQKGHVKAAQDKTE